MLKSSVYFSVPQGFKRVIPNIPVKVQIIIIKRQFVMTLNFRAILTCLLAYLFFDLMSVHVRILSIDYSPQELSVYRNVIGVVPAIFYMWYSKELSLKISDYKIQKWKLGIFRGLMIAVAQLCFSSFARAV